MTTSIEKWKRGVKKIVTRKDSNVSSNGSVLNDDNMDDEMEVSAYLNNLKRKTGLQNLWSGHKFEGILENERTPDISVSSDESLDVENIKGLHLDSDEDELRIDYLREERLKDENNNELPDSQSSNSSINLMQNIHFAELANDNSMQLTNSYIKSEQSNDYLPKIEVLNVDKTEDSSLHERLYDLIDRKSDRLKISNSKVSSVHTEDNYSEIESIKSEDETSYKSIMISDRSEKTDSRSHSGKSKTESLSRSENSNTKSTSKSRSSVSSKHKSRHSSKSSSRHSTNESRDRTLSESGTLSETSDISDSSLASKKSSSEQMSKSKKSKRIKEKERVFLKDSSVQTDKQDIDYTEKVLNFKYSWQSPEPSRIAEHVIDPIALDVMTNYNPAVLAANDMMKFHLDLLRKSIENSRRLYEAYSSIDSSSSNDFRYTTVEDTMAYIRKNRPKVSTYEDALRKIEKKKQR